MQKRQKVITVLVCGGRDFFFYSDVKNELEDIVAEREDGETVVIISGEAKGADTLAKIYVVDEWSFLGEHSPVTYKGFPADWKTYGSFAGLKRNQQMLDEGKPDLVLAFPGGAGTADMVKRAKAAGVKVRDMRGLDLG